MNFELDPEPPPDSHKAQLILIALCLFMLALPFAMMGWVANSYFTGNQEAISQNATSQGNATVGLPTPVSTVKE